MPEKLAALLAQPVLQLSAAELIDLFTGLAVIARSEGILAVEEIIPVCRDWLLRIFLDDVVSGMEPELAGKLAETHSDFLLHCEKTRCAMIVRGVECIAAGVHPFLVQDMMHAFFAFTAAGESIANPPLDSRALNESGHLESPCAQRELGLDTQFHVQIGQLDGPLGRWH